MVAFTSLIVNHMNTNISNVCLTIGEKSRSTGSQFVKRDRACTRTGLTKCIGFKQLTNYRLL